MSNINSLQLIQKVLHEILWFRQQAPHHIASKMLHAFTEKSIRWKQVQETVLIIHQNHERGKKKKQEE